MLGGFILYAAVQGFLLAGYLLVRPSGDRAAQRMLALLVGFMSIHLTDLTISWTDVFELAPRLFSNSWTVLFTVGPIFWLYIRRLIEPRQALRWRDALHFLPAALVLASMIPWITAPVDYRLSVHRYWLSDVEKEVSTRGLTLVAFNILQILCYQILSLRLVAGARRKTTAVTADNQVLAALGSLRNLVTAFVAWEVFYLLVFVALITWGGFGREIDAVWLLINGLFLQFGALQAVARPEFFGNTMEQAVDLEEDALEPACDSETDDQPAAESPEPTKYRKSNLSPESASVHRRTFEKLMEQEKPYLNGSLRLADLAARIDISSHNLSQVLNQELGASFFDIVNSYRVAEAKRLMVEPSQQHLSLLAVAFEAGFSNKNSFNRAFKTREGMTPSTYRKNAAT